MPDVTWGPILDDDLIRVELPDGNWVAVKAAITAHDQAAAQSAATMKYRGLGGKAEDIEAAFDSGKYQLVLLQRMVKAWSFSRNGIALPCTPDNIGRLPERTRTRLMERINAENVPLSEDEHENLSLPTLISSEEMEPAPLS